MPILSMRAGTAHFLVSEANGYRSRSEFVVANTAVTPLLAGTVLGRLTAATATASDPSPTNTGNPTFGSITAASTTMIGNYRITFLTATTFSVARPDGVLLANGATGVAYNQGGLAFTLTAGGTAAVAGDNFNIAVVQRVGDFVRHTTGGSDGSQTVAGILFEEVPASASLMRTIIRRDAEVNAAHLTYASGSSGAQITTANDALLAFGIAVR